MWFVLIALSHTLVNNPTQREHMLRVQISTEPNAPPTTLMCYLSQRLVQCASGPATLQRRISLLQFLSIWLANCPAAVGAYLEIPENISFLISQIALGVEGGDEGTLEPIVQGLCSFLFGLCLCFNNDSREGSRR